MDTGQQFGGFLCTREGLTPDAATTPGTTHAIWVLSWSCRQGRCFPNRCSKRPALTLNAIDVERTVFDSKDCL